MKYTTVKMMHRLTILLLFSSLLACNGFGQTITINSIDNARENNGFGGYTLNGSFMDNASAKLLNQANFGPAGIYPKRVTIVSGYAATGSLTQVTDLPQNQIFFFGAFGITDPLLQQFTAAEIDSLYAWSKRGGKLIIGGSAVEQGYDPAVLNGKWGFDIALVEPTVLTPTLTGNNTTIFRGPFGNVTTAIEGGSAQGYFDVTPPNAIILANNAGGEPAMIIDCNTLDLIVPDVDLFSSVGSISAGDGLSNMEDAFWMNTIVFMDQLEGPPVITRNGFTLSTSTYNAYQWYLDSVPITGATGQSYTVTDSGVYSVQVTLSCGCKVMSDTVIMSSPHPAGYVVPSAFTPNGDGKNDVLYVKGSDIDKLTFTVYDRWGEKVFESHNISNGWDGTFNGKALNAQVFLYYLELTYTTGETVKDRGAVTLLR